MSRHTPIVPPATIGMLGGGQLGKYAIVAANAMGYRTVVLDPDPHAPAAVMANTHLSTAYDDPDALAWLGANAGVVTTEFENPPATSLETLARSTSVAPNPTSVAIAQDRIAEKAFMVDHDIAVGPHVALRPPVTDEQLRLARELADGGAIVKTARMGYDGKGQHRVGSASELDAVLADIGDTAVIVEGLLQLDLELSVLVARTADGATVTWDVAENQHVDGILDLSVVPARVSSELAAGAVALAVSIAGALDFVGVLAVELFVVDGGSLLVNEIAPRPHNSGHWTLDASVTSQFEQQIRAVCGVGLGSTAMTAPAVAMVNLLGDRWFTAGPDPVEPDWATALSDPDATLHLYGKTEPRPGRKMGHLTVTADSPDEAATTALTLRTELSTTSRH